MTKRRGDERYGYTHEDCRLVMNKIEMGVGVILTIAVEIRKILISDLTCLPLTHPRPLQRPTFGPDC